MQSYDYIIVGGGPSGLSTAWLLARYGFTSLIIERNEVIGGCHRVKRVDGLFTEHGPRIYSSTYKMFITLLADMGLDFYQLFTPYNFNISHIGQQSARNMTWSELYHFAMAYIRMFFDPTYGKKISMSEFMNQNHFSSSTRLYIDRLCRLTDGADVRNYTLYQFFQLLNQQILYQLYQPVEPNDEGLFRHITDALKRTHKIDILLAHEVIRIDQSNSLINNITIKNLETNQLRNIPIKNLILAVPPKPMVKLITSSNISNPFKIINLEKWAMSNSYFDYIPITFHWKHKLTLPKIWGFPSSDWGIAFVVLSDYFKDDSKGIISTAITSPDNISRTTGKTAHQSTSAELITEVFRQLRLAFPTLPFYTKAIISPNVYHHNGKWIDRDTAFVQTPNAEFIDYQSPVYSNLCTVGTHNGKSLYNFTSMESAVTNAFGLIHQIIPKSKTEFPIQRTHTLNEIIIIMGIILVFAVVLYQWVHKGGLKNMSQRVQ